MSGLRGVMPAVIAGVLTLSLSGCAEPPTAPSLDAVREERSLTVTSEWLQAAAGTQQYIARQWPEAVRPALRFERWVEPERALAEWATCIDQILDRASSSTSGRGILEFGPRPATEPTWALPVAQLQCQMQLVPWSGFYPFGGSLEQEWVRHQITVALPNCVRRWGGELVVPDLAAAVDASVYPTSSDGSAGATQSVWLAAELHRVDEATAQQIRLGCPDPGQTLVQLGPAEIRSLDFGPSGDGRSILDDGPVSP